MNQTNSSSDRNLLFGILAVQLDFIDGDELIAAMNTWVLNKSRALDEILTEAGTLDADERKLLVALVQKHLNNHENNPEKSLASVSTNGSLRAALSKVDDAKVASLVDTLGSSFGDTDLDATESFPKPTTDSGTGLRFHILRPHAKGGLGKVSVAMDNELNREVALKEIQEQLADDSESRARFLLEAEITGGLEHPGVVPVYGLGHYDDGRPFYAMRFVRGDSLKEAVDSFHKETRENTKEGNVLGQGERLLEFRKLLGRFIDVCDAMDYAHSRGVLHRDLKPGNIMLGKYGETFVVDWGLAKTLDKKEPSVDTSERTLLPSSDNSATPTQMGTAVGTPSYMSPEQATGRLDLLGPESDVYSLGATLYYVLTGQNPFKSSDDEPVLRRVERGEFPPPRDIAPWLPRSLESVCLRAMAKDGDDRHSSPRELAEDIESWLADEPVSSWQEPPSIRVKRWIRNHQTLVSTAAVAVVLVTIGLGVIATVTTRGRNQLARANRDLQEANAAERTAKEEAESQRALALESQKQEEAAKLEAIQQRNAAQRSLYLSNIVLAHQAWRTSSVGSMSQLLDAHLREEGQPDLRGWEWHYLRTLARQELHSIKCYEERLEDLAWSPDGTQIATVNSDGLLRICEVKTGKFVTTEQAHGERTTSIAWNSAGSVIAATAFSGSVKLLKPTGELIATISSHVGVVRTAWSRDGTRFATAGKDGQLLIWDTKGKQVSSHKLSAEPNSISWGAEGKQLAIALKDALIVIFDIEQDKLVGSLVETEAKHLDWSRDGKKLVSVHDSGNIVIWDMAERERLFSLKARNDNPTVPGRVITRWSPDSRLILMARASLGRSGGIAILDVDEKRQTLNVRTGQIEEARWSPDGKLIATAGSDGYLKVWDPARDSEFREVRTSQNVDYVAWSHDGTKLAGSGWWLGAEPLSIWNYDESTQSISGLLKSPEPTISIAWAPDGRLATGGSRSIRVYSMDKLDDPLVLAGHRRQVNALAWHPRDNILASSSHDRLIKIWDLSTGKELRQFKGHTENILAIAWNPAGDQLASTGHDHKIRIWNVTSGDQVAEFEGHPKSTVMSLDWSGDGQLIATCANTEVRLWDVASGKLRAALEGHLSLVTSVKFHPHENRLATCGFDSTAKIWDTESGQLLLSLRTRAQFPRTISWTSDGKRLAAANFSRITIWDTQVRKKIDP